MEIGASRDAWRLRCFFCFCRARSHLQGGDHRDDQVCERAPEHVNPSSGPRSSGDSHRAHSRGQSERLAPGTISRCGDRSVVGLTGTHGLQPGIATRLHCYCRAHQGAKVGDSVCTRLCGGGDKQDLIWAAGMRKM